MAGKTYLRQKFIVQCGEIDLANYHYRDPEEGWILGLRYDELAFDGEIMVGGPVRFREAGEMLLVNFFDAEVGSVAWVKVGSRQKAYLRGVDMFRWMRGLVGIYDTGGWFLRRTQRFGRLCD